MPAKARKLRTRSLLEDIKHGKNPVCMPRQDQDGKPGPPVISALFKPVPSQFTPHLHQTQPHGALTKAPGRAGTAGQTWGFHNIPWQQFLLSAWLRRATLHHRLEPGLLKVDYKYYQIKSFAW